LITRSETGSLELWLEIVRGIVGRPTDGLTLLDLCCNECTSTGKLKFKRHIGVDVVDWATRPEHVHFYKSDVLRAFPYQQEPFDVCICSDGIEHLPKEGGYALIANMAVLSRLAIIFTPLGPYMLNPDATDPDAHKSAWTPEEFEAMGWDVIAFPRWHPTLNVGAFFATKGKLD
jgi:hypothetical protein